MTTREQARRQQQARETEFAVLTLASSALSKTRPADGSEQEGWYSKTADLDLFISTRRTDLNAESIEAGNGDLYTRDADDSSAPLAPLGRAYRLLRGEG